MPFSKTIVLVPLLLAACGVQADETPNRTGGGTLDTPAAKGDSTDASIATLAPMKPATYLPADAGKLPPATRKHRFVGRWAESLDQCPTESWWLSEGPRGIVRPDGQTCDLREVTGRIRYRAVAWCPPPPSSPGQLDVGYTVTFAFDETTQRMIAEGLSFPEARLVFCGTEH